MADKKHDKTQFTFDDKEHLNDIQETTEINTDYLINRQKKFRQRKNQKMMNMKSHCRKMSHLWIGKKYLYVLSNGNLKHVVSRQMKYLKKYY